MKTLKKTAIAFAVSSLLVSVAQAGEVEVLHWWTSGGEAKSVAVLKQLLEKEGHTWKDFAVAGGGGENAMTVLKSRAVAGNPPAAAQIKGPEIQEWAKLGFLTDITPVATKAGWDKMLPGVVSAVMKHEGKYVAVPVNVHRVNWLWANAEVLKSAGVAKAPTTWAEFFDAADKVKKKGLVAFAHGGQAWQDATVFEAVVLGTGGTEFYNSALVKLDDAALSGPKMVEALKTFKRLRDYMDPDFAGRDWNLATAMVINGKAAFQIMGDWAKGEFTAANKKPGKDFLCVAAPGTGKAYTFNIDSFAMFKVKDMKNQEAQNAMARLILEPTFQETFNLNKGSIPVRTSGVDKAKFDSCAVTSMNDFASTAKSGGLVPSMAHGMAISSAKQGAIYDVVTKFFNDTKMTAEEAAQTMAKAVKSAN
jgi:glucose/mannose transport system substrate-binding protein